MLRFMAYQRGCAKRSIVNQRVSLVPNSGNVLFFI
jgi:hypothetical protein